MDHPGAAGGWVSAYWPAWARGFAFLLGLRCLPVSFTEGRLIAAGVRCCWAASLRSGPASAPGVPSTTGRLQPDSALLLLGRWPASQGAGGRVLRAGDLAAPAPGGPPFRSMAVCSDGLARPVDVSSFTGEPLAVEAQPARIWPPACSIFRPAGAGGCAGLAPKRHLARIIRLVERPRARKAGHPEPRRPGCRHVSSVVAAAAAPWPRCVLVAVGAPGCAPACLAADARSWRHGAGHACSGRWPGNPFSLARKTAIAVPRGWPAPCAWSLATPTAITWERGLAARSACCSRGACDRDSLPPADVLFDKPAPHQGLGRKGDRVSWRRIWIRMRGGRKA